MRHVQCKRLPLFDIKFQITGLMSGARQARLRRSNVLRSVQYLIRDDISALAQRLLFLSCLPAQFVFVLFFNA